MRIPSYYMAVTFFVIGLIFVEMLIFWIDILIRERIE
jgi:hypothetical protein